MNKKRLIGSIIVGVAVLTLVFTLGRTYYSPGSGDAGIVAPQASASLGANTVGPEGSSADDSQSKPSVLHIPKINISTHVQLVGVTEDGLMGVPTNFTDVGWYKYGPLPGHVGSSVIAGHQDRAGGRPAIFYELEKLRVGDSVYVEREDGKRLHFKVTKTELLPYDLKGPKLEEIFNKQGGRYLNLITCAGNWVPSAKTNDLRLVVYTELVE